MKITAVEKLKEKDMMRIFIDGRYAFAIPQEDYIRNDLYEEEEITEEKLAQIRQNVLVRAAKERGLRYLTMKDRSEEEVLKKLTEAGFDQDVSRSAVNDLKVLGYLNDSRYAMRYLSERVKLKALSQKAIKFELQHKGIAPDIIDSVLTNFEANDEETALRAARKKFSKYDVNDQKVERKILSFLYHRGFSFELCQKVLKSMKADTRQAGK
jgi:regulatory protein